MEMGGMYQLQNVHINHTLTIYNKVTTGRVQIEV